MGDVVDVTLKIINIINNDSLYNYIYLYKNEYNIIYIFISLNKTTQVNKKIIMQNQYTTPYSSMKQSNDNKVLFTLMDGFYIPRISTKYNAVDVILMFSKIGEAYRVDFTSIIHTSNSNNNNNNTNIHQNPDGSVKYQSAFVHFNKVMKESFLINNINQTIFDMNNPVECKLSNNNCMVKYIATGKGYKFYLQDKSYIILLPNKNNIPNTNLNLHQIVENNKILEERVNDQDSQINLLIGSNTQLEQEIYELTIRNENITNRLNYLEELITNHFSV
jgi:hypothetical protein